MSLGILQAALAEEKAELPNRHQDKSGELKGSRAGSLLLGVTPPLDMRWDSESGLDGPSMSARSAILWFLDSKSRQLLSGLQIGVKTAFGL